MNHWNRWLPFGAVAAAGLVLSVSVFSQLASASPRPLTSGRPASASGGVSASAGVGGCSGSCAQGSVTGTVTVVGAPVGFSPAFEGAGACPASGRSSVACADPLYSLAANGEYSLSLPPGSWDVSAFYENSGFGGVFLSAPILVSVPSGGTVTANFTVAYQRPATAKGMVRITGAPPGVTVYRLSVLLCPSFAPYSGGTPSIACVTTGAQSFSGTDAAPFEVTGLPPGAWTAFPGYCTEFGCSIDAQAGRVVRLVAGRTSRFGLRGQFTTPGDGILSAMVTVTGTPAGFSDPVAISACEVSSGSCQTGWGFGGGTITMVLADGQWTVNGLYAAEPFGNAIDGPTRTVTISGGRTTAVALDVPYQVLGTASGTIRVVGAHRHLPIISYTVEACPSPDHVQSSPQCVSEYSGPSGSGVAGSLTGAIGEAAGGARARIDRYQITTLTPGSWILYPGYGTALGSYTDPVGTRVTISAARTTTQRLTVPFQAPTTGVVIGVVGVVGAPVGGIESGVQACNAPPSGLSCDGGQDAYSQGNGTYALTLAPGTWWLSGFADLFTAGGFGRSTTPPREVTITAGARLRQNFTVTIATP